MKNSRVKTEIAAFEKRINTLQEELISSEVQLQENDAMVLSMRNEILDYRKVLQDLATGIASAYPQLAQSINETLNKYPQAKIQNYETKTP
jgi:septal ring factor EnvC (AmiA/AmiB activator)